MFEVYFIPRGVFPRSIEDQAGQVCIFKSLKEVEAVQFALSLHQACNVPHAIRVVSSSDDVIATFFVPKEDK